MKRGIVNILSALSLAFCLAVAVLWVRSYWSVDWIWHHRYANFYDPQRVDEIAFASYYGGFHCLIEADAVAIRVTAKGKPFGGIFQFRFQIGGPYARSEIRVPDWVFLLFFALLPGFWLRRWTRAHHHRVGHCRACGYDLRASPERCPECGEIPAGAAR